LAGFGRFHAEIWILASLGIDFSSASKAALNAARFFFDALFPFVLLFTLSWVTRPVPGPVLDRFFARQHTPVQATPEAEQAALAESAANPRRFEADKVWPDSQWEIMKPAWQDYAGFFGTWALVGVIVLLLWAMVTIR
jgi:SSS family solute:Na+ symporter